MNILLTLILAFICTMLAKRTEHDSISRILPKVDGMESLAELALDMRWSWNHAADRVWRMLDPDLWNITRNPWVVLQTVSRDRIEHALENPNFRKQLDELLQA